MRVIARGLNRPVGRLRPLWARAAFTFVSTVFPRRNYSDCGPRERLVGSNDDRGATRLAEPAANAALWANDRRQKTDVFDGTAVPVNLRSDRDKFNRVVSGSRAFVDAKPTVRDARVRQARRPIDGRESEYKTPLFRNRQRTNCAGRAHAATVRARRFAAGPIGV